MEDGRLRPQLINASPFCEVTRPEEKENKEVAMTSLLRKPSMGFASLSLSFPACVLLPPFLAESSPKIPLWLSSMSWLNRTVYGVRIQELGLRDLAASPCAKPPPQGHNHTPLAV